MLEALVAAAFFFGTLASSVTRRAEATLEGRAIASMRSSGLYGLISLLGAVGLVAAFVASFFILQWWLPIIMVVVLGFLAGLPAFYIGRDVERAMNIHPLLNLISAALGGTVVTVAVGLLHLPSIMFML